MTPRPVNAADELVYRSLRDPHILHSLSAPEWDRLLRRARRAGVLSRLAVRSEELLHEDELPERVSDHLSSARLVAAHHVRDIRREVKRIRYALQPIGEPFVLLKGAAYVMAGLPAGAGRLASDVDILVAREKLDIVEGALMRAGWESMKLDPYDQRFYRTWMHELPPLRHGKRNTVVDVHHAILPQTARLRPDASKLLAGSVPIDGVVSVLSPADMVLHAATHLFADGDLEGGLREVVDLDALLRHFSGVEPGFWERLVPRSEELGLQRPLFYALAVCRRLLETPVPQGVVDASEIGRPAWPATPIMERLADRALLPDTEGNDWGAGVALWILYLRSHWMRMPPWLLTRHLTRKTFRRWFGEAG